MVAFSLFTLLQAWAGGGSMENQQKATSADYWTPERLQQARPMPLPRPSRALPRQTEESVPGGAPVGALGREPVIKIHPDERLRLLPPGSDGATPAEQADETFAEPAVQESRSVGTSGAHFTSSRLIPLTADKVYPYRTVGKLFFADGNDDLVCSASVIRRGLILTAGHCVHKGSGGQSGFFTNFLFVPAYRDGNAPYGRWNWNWVTTTNAWMTGGGTFPNAADYALIEVQDNARGQRIGDVIGVLGYLTQALFPNHAHLLGYPLNLDNGQKMHQVTAGSFQQAFPNAVEYGSDMTNGSSGGPWIQNFGKKADGQTGSSKDGPNQVIGVTSYGRIAPEPKLQGSSILDQRFIDLLNAACAHRQGNC